MTEGNDEPLMTVGDAAVRIMVKPRTISRWIATGLPFIPNGKEKLVHIDDLLARRRLELRKKRSSRLVRALLDTKSDEK